MLTEWLSRHHPVHVFLIRYVTKLDTNTFSAYGAFRLTNRLQNCGLFQWAMFSTFWFNPASKYRKQFSVGWRRGVRQWCRRRKYYV